MTHPANLAPTSNQTCIHRKTTKNLQPTHCKNSEIYTKPTTSHPKNRRPTASHRTQKPTTTQTPLATTPKNPQQPEHRKPPHQTHQHKTQQTNKTTKNSQKIQSFRTVVRLQIMVRRERSKVRRVGAQVDLQICFGWRWH